MNATSNPIERGAQLPSLLGAFPYQRDPDRYTPMSRPLRMRPYLEARFDYEFLHIRPLTSINYYFDYGTTYASLLCKLAKCQSDGMLVWNYYYVPILAKMKRKKIVDVTDITRPITHNRLIKGMTVDMVEGRLMGRMDLIIVQVKEKKEEYEKRYPGVRVRYVPNGVDTEVFTPDASVEKRYDFCFLGKVEEQYHVKELIGAIAMSQATALFVGGGRDLERYREYARDRGSKVTFQGYVPHEEVPRLLATCRFGLQPTQHGGPLKLYEYLACGLPVVSRQAVDDSIVEGVHLVPGGGEAEYAEVLGRLLSMSDSEYRGVSARCREESLKFSLDGVGQRYCDAVAEVLE